MPLRIEIGEMRWPATVVIARRHNIAKFSCPMEDVVPVVAKTLVDVHDCMLEDARKERDAHLAIATTWEQF